MIYRYVGCPWQRLNGRHLCCGVSASCMGARALLDSRLLLAVPLAVALLDSHRAVPECCGGRLALHCLVRRNCLRGRHVCVLLCVLLQCHAM